MITSMHLAQVLTIDVGVDLRRGDVGVPKHLLYRTKIRAALQEMGRERVSQCVRGDALGDPGALHVLREDLPGAHPGERRAAGVEKERAPRAPAGAGALLESRS